MRAPSTAREVLIAEAIGDLARLLDQVEGLQAAMLESHRALVDANAQFAGRLADFETQIIALTERAKVQAVKHILSRTEDAARRSVDVQSRAMAEAAQTLFKAAVGPALQRLAEPLEQLVQRVDRPWERWLTHAATAAVASAVTCALVYWPWAR